MVRCYSDKYYPITHNDGDPLCTMFYASNIFPQLQIFGITNVPIIHQAHCGSTEATRKEYYFINTELKMCSFIEGRKHTVKRTYAQPIPRNPEETASYKIRTQPCSTVCPSNSPDGLSYFSSRMVSTKKVYTKMGSSLLYCILKALLSCATIWCTYYNIIHMRVFIF